MKMKIILFLSLILSALCGQAQGTGSVQVATSAPNNRSVTVYYRVPKGYDAKRLAGDGNEWILSQRRWGAEEFDQNLPRSTVKRINFRFPDPWGTTPS